MHFLNTLVILLVSLILTGCFNLIVSEPAVSNDQGQMPLLSPASYGSSQRLYQHIKADFPKPNSQDGDERSQNEFKAIVDITPEAISIVALGPLNRPVLQTAWDGEQLQTQMIQALIDAEFSAERLLRDVQLTLWPCEAWQEALEARPSFSLECTASPKQRILRKLGTVRYQISYPAPNAVELHNLENNYKLIIKNTQ